MLSSNCAVCNSKKSRCIKEQEASDLLSSLGVKIPLSQIFILDLFRYKMNKIINKFLFAGDKFMPQMHLRQPRFTYSACGPFTKSKKGIQKFKETGYSRKIYQKELDKTCFQHDMAYGGFKDLPRRIASDKVLHGKAFNIAKNLKYDGYQRGLASMFYKILIKIFYWCC